MEKEYGAEKGKKVFYASENKGTIKGVTKHDMAKKMNKHGFTSEEEKGYQSWKHKRTPKSKADKKPFHE